MAATMTDASAIVGAETRSPTSSSSPPMAAADAEKLRFIEDMTTNADAVQVSVLAEILRRNADSEYLLNCGLAGATDRATFRAKVPMVTYEDLQPYIQRIAGGDRAPILSGSAHPVSEFLASSGTSGGQRKLIPVVEDDVDRRVLLHRLLMPVMSQYVSGLDQGSGLYFASVKSETTTPGGLPASTAMTSFLKSDKFKNLPEDAYHKYTGPPAATLCEDAFQSMYAQMLCGLCQRHDVLRVGALFAYGLVLAIRFLQLNWEQLAADVDSGELTPRVNDPSVRREVAGVLRPDAGLARFIRAECSKDDWAAIITRIWPNTKYLDTVVTGSMAQYVPALKHYGGGLPIASTMYASSKCSFGLNLRPMCDPSEVSYTIMPNMGYFEFLPVNDADGATCTAASRLVELAGVEAGREYEVVVTTHAGLCRYRVGDVLRVAGFHNAAPRFRFVRRGNAVLSVGCDKTDEAELQRAVERAASAQLRPRGAAVADYTATACTRRLPGHYVVFWELMAATAEKADRSGVDGGGGGGGVDGDVLERCCVEMEEALSAVYRQKRAADGDIGALEIRVVRWGTFEELGEYAVARGASVSQYKVPRCVSDPCIIQLLDSRVVSRHFSPALPHWAPDQR
ncbi:hypothetical protein ACP4OV_016853 [Aristida adscensionis]